MRDINATIIVDLTPNEEKIKARLHKDARWGIGRAERDGLVVEENQNPEDWKEFYEIYKNTMKLGGTMPETLENLKKNSEVFFVCKNKEGKVIAGAGIWFLDKYDFKIPRLYFNASLSEYQKSQPNNLLYWKCILWCKEKGYGKFDLGGWQINARGHLKGINKFKEKWGEIVYYDREYPLHIALGRKLIRKFEFFWWLNKKIKKRK